jgi:Putative prokaryotic signal transducing protein
MRLLRSYQNLLEAGFAHSLLESSGIAAILENEASTSLSPAGACQARLMVPDEQFAEAERIIAEHPTHFAGIVDDVPRFGFWRGSVLALLVYLFASGLLLALTGSAHFNLGIMAIVWFLGGAIGANYKVKKPPARDTEA